MTFTDAMSLMCPTCNRRAGWHRMTDSGNMYCLKLNKAGAKRRNTMIRNGYGYDPATMHHISVEFLVHAPFEGEVVDVITQGLSTYMEQK